MLSRTSPNYGPTGTVVTFTGTNFGATQGSSVLTFGSTAATPTSWSNTQIVAPVPSGAANGWVGIALTVNGLTNANSQSFEVGNPPVISTTSPNFGPPATVVTFTGTNFGATQGSSLLSFGSTAATPTSWSNTQIVAPVPSGIANGWVAIGLTVNGLTNPISQSFEVGNPPVITGLTPNHGPTGTVVTFTGTNFGATQGSSVLKFGSTVATPTSWSNTQIAAPVPSMANGWVLIGLTVNGLTNPNPQTFEVGNPPVITGLTPDHGPPATVVTVTGTNFGATQGSSTVYLQTPSNVVTTLTPMNWSNTQIVSTIPSGTPNGLNYVFLKVNGLVSVGTIPFTVTTSLTIAGLSPLSGPVGTAVTITGTNFGTTQGTSTVKFNGIAGTPTNWSNTQIGVPVPNGATTGNVVVTVGGVSSNGIPFTVAPTLSSVSPTSATVGASVTIMGTNFGDTQGTSSVKFNGTTATATTWSNSSIIAVVPVGATTGPIVLTVAGLASKSLPFTVNSGSTGPAPPSNLVATVASNTRIILAWTGSPTPGITYKVIRNGVLISSGLTTTSYSDATVSPNTQYSYQVEATNAQGTSTPTNSATVTIVPPSPPSGLIATPLTFSGISLSWLRSSTPNVVYTAFDATTTLPQFSFVPQTSGTVVGLSGGTMYCFYVNAALASNLFLQSTPSNTSCATTPVGTSCTASDAAAIIAGPDPSLNIEYELIAKVDGSDGNSENVPLGSAIAFGVNALPYFDCNGVLQAGEADEGNEFFDTSVPQIQGQVAFRWFLDDWILCPDPIQCTCDPEDPNPGGEEEIAENFPNVTFTFNVLCP